MNSANRRTKLLLIAILVTFVSFSEAKVEASVALSSKQKRIIPIAAHTASGNLQELEKALVEGLDGGLTVNEIKEIFVHTYAYAGFPRALNGIDTFMAVLEKREQQGVIDNVGPEATPVPADFDMTAHGHKVRNSIVGRDMSNPTSGYQVFVPAIDQFLVDHLFGSIFYRDVLNYQERQLITISVLSAMSGTQPQLRSHLGVSMNVGLSKEQLDEFILVLRDYVSIESSERANEALHALLKIKSPMVGKSVQVTKKHLPIPGAAEYFTGNVTVESRFVSNPSENYQGAIVNFDTGARTAWHTHPLGQTLIVTSGRGLVQSEGSEIQEILPGDVIWIPANVRHWHGAVPDSPMSHVAISSSLNGSTVEWHELVSDEQYLNRN